MENGRSGASGSGRWVLVTDGDDGQSRTPLATVQALSVAGYRPAVTMSGRYSLAGASRLTSRRVQVPQATSSGYLEAIRAEMDRLPYVTVLPTSDVALMALAPQLRSLVDKELLVDAVESVGLSLPPTRTFESSDALLASAHRLDYPVVVKPAMGHPARRAQSAADLSLLDGLPGRWIVQPFLSDGLRSLAGVMWKGRLASAVHQRFLRTWPRDCGMASLAETIEPDLDLEERIQALLGEYDGVFQVDVVGGFVLDVNPRAYASLPLAVGAGVNVVAQYCELCANDHEAGQADWPIRSRTGVTFRWLDGDVRAVVGAWRAGDMALWQAVKQLPSRVGTAPAFQLLRDPRPFVERIKFGLSRRHLESQPDARGDDARGPASGVGGMTG
jgi:hypothetical protein